LSLCIKTAVPAQTHLLRQMMRADVEGSLAAFFAAAAPLLAGGGVDEALPLGAASACALFFLRAMFQSSGYATLTGDVCSALASEMPYR
jgi:phage-related tail fiber protein